MLSIEKHIEMEELMKGCLLPHPYQQLEDTIMIHRFLYYIEFNPIISDSEYDALERNGRSLLKDKLDSPVHQNGSELRESYSDRIRQLALHWIES